MSAHSMPPTAERLPFPLGLGALRGRWRLGLLAAALFLSGLTLWQRCAAPLLPATVGASAESCAVPTAAPEVATGPDEDGTDTERTIALAATPDAAPPSYATYVERLVTMGLATSHLDAAGDRAAAAESDRDARGTMTELMERIVDAEQLALDALLASAPPPASDLPGQIRRQVHHVVLRLGLERRHRAALQDPGRASTLESLVAAMLSLLPTRDDLAVELGNGQLADRPYLSIAHEPAVQIGRAHV